MRHSSLSRCTNQAAVRGVASVHALLETLDLAQSKRGVSAKKALRDYARLYFELLPPLDPSTIKMLLVGSSNLKGLIAACGTTSWKQIRELKKSSVQALELLARLLDDETNPHATQYREQLSHISKQQLKQMKLDRHVLSERAQTDVACLVIGHVLSSRSDIEVPFLLESADARSIFSDWEEEQRLLEPEIDAEEYDGAGYFDIRQHKGPKAWVDINEEEIDRLAAEFDGERDGGPMIAEGAGGGGGQSEDIASEAIGKDPLGILDLKPGVFKRQQKKKFWAKRNKEKHERQAVDGVGVEPSLALIIPQGSSSPYDEDFSPVLFLLEFHRKTSFKNVQRGLQNLREIVDNRVNLMRQLVHDHFDQFVNCKDAIDSIHVLLSDEMSSSDSDSRTGSVLPELRLVLNRANKLYQPMLERNMEADRIRSVLAVLKRFHFLFAMPGNLRRNIKAQHYDKVVRDYQKVKLLQDSDVALLEEVLSEIHLIISQFRAQLKNALHDPNGIIEEQTRLIAYLVELDCEEDPVWYFLDRQQEWICSEMRRLEGKHLARTRGAAGPAKAPPHLDTEEEEPESSGTSSNRTEEENGPVVSVEDVEGVGSIDVAGSDHSTQKLVWSLTAILRSRMPRLWRLTRDAVLGKAEREHSSNIAKDRVNNFFGEILNTYANVVEKTIVCTPSESKTTIRMPPSMEANICQILRCHEFLASLGIPSAFIASIRELSDRSAQFFIEQSLRSAVGDIARFPSLEDWHIDDDIHCCSVLPRLFRERITKLLDVVRQICAVSASAASWVAQRVSAPLLEIFRVFTDCLHQLAFKHHSGALSDAASELSSIDSSFKTSTTKLPKYRRSEDQHLLLIISNSVHARTDVMPDLWSAYVELLPFRVAALSSEFNKVVSLMKTFESMVLERFLRCKTLSLNAIIRKGIMTCGIAWLSSAEPKDLRGYVLELLLELVFVHEQVNKISPDELGRVLRFLLLQIAIGFDECLKQIDEIGVNGAAQLLIEIVFVKRTLKNYLTSESSEILKQIESELQEATGGEGEGKRGEILHSGRAATNIMFECFR